VTIKRLAAVGLAASWIVVGSAEQPPPRTPGDNQPGRKWSEAQLKQFANVVSAGRKLTPKSWPNGARVIAPDAGRLRSVDPSWSVPRPCT